MQEKGDAFDAMVESESRIRLGEEGWKERYYQVLPGRRCSSLRLCDGVPAAA